MINRRTDLFDGQKEELIRANKNRELADRRTPTEIRQGKAVRENMFRQMREEQMQAQMAQRQQAMMGQIMQQNPELAVRMMEMQQRGQLGQGQLVNEQQRIANDGTYRSGMLELDGRRLDNQESQFSQQYGLDEMLGIGRLANDAQANDLRSQGLKAQQDAASAQSGQLGPNEWDAVMALTQGNLEQGMPQTDAFNSAMQQVRSQIGGQQSPPFAPPQSQGAPPAGSQAATTDPVQAQANLARMSAPNSLLNKTFSVLGLPEQPEALDIASSLIGRLKKNARMSSDSLNSIREYMLSQNAIDPEFISGAEAGFFAKAFSPVDVSVNKKAIELLTDQSVPVEDIYDILSHYSKTRTKMQQDNNELFK
jgi:hypothetical protein